MEQGEGQEQEQERRELLRHLPEEELQSEEYNTLECQEYMKKNPLFLPNFFLIS